MSKKAVVIVSGGLDSSVLAYQLKDFNYDLHMLSFFYGQRHRKELKCATDIAKLLGAKHDVINISDVAALFASSLTTQRDEVPDGHYSEESMSKTVVPNRNAIMLSIAWGVAVSEGTHHLFFGAHAGDRAQYADCTQLFIDKLTVALRVGTKAMISLSAPFILATKTHIVAQGLKLGVPFNKTWSCYRGEDLACGRCGTCVERLEAFAENSTEDPLLYQDREFWKQAVAEFNSGIRK